MEVPLLAVERTQDLPSTPPGMEEAVEFARVASEVLAAITGLEVEAMDPAAAASLGLEGEALVLALDDTLVQQEALLLSARRTSEESMVHSSTHLSKDSALFVARSADLSRCSADLSALADLVEKVAKPGYEAPSSPTEPPATASVPLPPSLGGGGGGDADGGFQGSWHVHAAEMRMMMAAKSPAPARAPPASLEAAASGADEGTGSGDEDEDYDDELITI